jgi:hypothetical protein
MARFYVGREAGCGRRSAQNAGRFSAIAPVEVAIQKHPRDHLWMPKLSSRTPLRGQDLISIAQRLARDAERHAILSASLASQADRLMLAGLRRLDGSRKSASASPVRS